MFMREARRSVGENFVLQDEQSTCKKRNRPNIEAAGEKKLSFPRGDVLALLSPKEGDGDEGDAGDQEEDLEEKEPV